MTATLFLATALSALSLPQSPGHVDFYGVRSTDEAALRRVLDQEGDWLDRRKELEAELRTVDGVVDATIMVMHVINSDAPPNVLIGILEEDTPPLVLRDAPTGSINLPKEFHEAYRKGLDASMEGMMKGEGGETTDEGHAISRYLPARILDLKLRDLTREHLDLVRRALRESGDEESRTVAANAIAYAEDKSSIVADLEHAITDPHDSVRNNAVRALSVLADWANRDDVDFEVSVDPKPLLAMLESYVWTDRNKASALLSKLTVRRDAGLLAALREHSIPALREMAMWRSVGHATFSIRILGRVAGLTEDEIAGELSRVRRDYDARCEWIAELAEAAAN